MSKKDDKSKKELAFYSASLSAWYTTRMEKDKSLLTLSVAAIGLLITLITRLEDIKVWVAALAILSFLVCAITIIIIFEKNATHIEDILNEVENPIKLAVLDNTAKYSFILGLILSFVFSLSSSYDISLTIEKKEKTVSEKAKFETNEPDVKSSVEGVNKLKPSGTNKSNNKGSGNDSSNKSKKSE